VEKMQLVFKPIPAKIENKKKLIKLKVQYK
jgi:hypothetical protein